MATRRTGPAGSGLGPWLGIAAIVVLLDQISKAVVVETLALGDSRVVTGFFNLVHWRNAGAAFSFLSGSSGWQRWVFVALAAFATFFIVWMLRRHGGQRLFAWALALILGGAIGNLIDRLARGSVVDFIQVHWRGTAFPSFNVADSAITIGAALLILDELRRVRHAK